LCIHFVRIALIASRTASASTTGTAAPATAIVVVLRRTSSATSSRYASCWYRRAVSAVEVRLGRLIELLASRFLKIITALNQNRALI
jgi:hypothetical protein